MAEHGCLSNFSAIWYLPKMFWRFLKRSPKPAHNIWFDLSQILFGLSYSCWFKQSGTIQPILKYLDKVVYCCLRLDNIWKLWLLLFKEKKKVSLGKKKEKNSCVLSLWIVLKTISCSTEYIANSFNHGILFSVIDFEKHFLCPDFSQMWELASFLNFILLYIEYLWVWELKRTILRHRLLTSQRLRGIVSFFPIFDINCSPISDGLPKHKNV